MTGARAYPTAAERVRLWAQELLEELLPRLPVPGRPVLLACDDETLRRVGERVCSQLGYPAAEAAERFTGDVKVCFEMDSKGLGLAHAGGFKEAPRPRELPDFFAVLCLLVLAASRMEPGEHPTHAYYVRLRELLGIGGEGQLPDIELVPDLFACLADWLADDLQGQRGRLLLPEHPGFRYVGTIVSQTVFRRRDRQVLAEFFSSRYPGPQDEEAFQLSDPLRRLRRWSGRWELTQHALRKIHDDTVASQVRAAIRAAYRSWDGSVSAEDREQLVRRWPARFRLLTNPLRLQLGADNILPINIEPDRQLERGEEIEVRFSLLNDLRFKAGWLGDPSSSAGVLWLPKLGDTVLVELGYDGLLRVDQPTETTVWVLACQGMLQSKLAPYLYPDPEDVLPQPWRLYAKVPVTELPDVTYDAPKGADDFWLEGGLPLERGCYLSGPGPVLAVGAVDVDGPLPVLVNRRAVGAVGASGRMQLPGDAGAYEVVVGREEWRTTYEVEEHGDPEQPGMLAHRLDAADALRSGARPVAGGERGVTVCGAAISIPYGHDPPILKRSLGDLWTIDRAGELERHPRPPDPAWLRQVGLPERGRPRWEITRDNVVWLLSPKPATGGRSRAELQRAVVIRRLSPEVAELVVGLHQSGPPILTARRGSGLSRMVVTATWNSLVRRAVFTRSGARRRRE